MLRCILTRQLLRDLNSCLAGIVLILHLTVAICEAPLSFRTRVCLLAGLQAENTLELGGVRASQD